MGVNSLPKTVTWQRRGCDLNSGPSAPECNMPTTWLPSCSSELINVNYQTWHLLRYEGRSINELQNGSHCQFSKYKTIRNTQFAGKFQKYHETFSFWYWQIANTTTPMTTVKFAPTCVRNSLLSELRMYYWFIMLQVICLFVYIGIFCLHWKKSPVYGVFGQ